MAKITLKSKDRKYLQRFERLLQSLEAGTFRSLNIGFRKLYNDLINSDDFKITPKKFAPVAERIQKAIEDSEGRAWLWTIKNNKLPDVEQTTAGVYAKQRTKDITKGIIATTNKDFERLVSKVNSIKDITEKQKKAMLKKAVKRRAGIRADTITRTEVHRGVTKTQSNIAKEIGGDIYKVWIAVNDERTRDDHADADGQRVRHDKLFTVGGEKLDEPNQINCRCAMGIDF